MKHKFAAFAMLFVAILTLGSCLKDDSENYVYTDDSAITSFYVTAAKQYHHTKTKTGADSVYVTKSSFSSYRFNIDQATNTISNPDSLPCGVDARKLVCSFAGLNSAAVYMKSLTSDSLTYISTSDSLDFSQPRELQVISNSGKALRKYTVKVNVHKEQPDSFAWHEMPNADFQSLIAAKTVALTTAEGGSRLLLFGTDGTATYVYVMNADNTWRLATLNFNHLLAADAYKGVVEQNGYAYLSDNGNIVRSADGETWTETGRNTSVVRLVAASPLRIYGYDANGKLLASADNGATWTAATLDSDASLLPTAETTYTYAPLRTNGDSYQVTLLGSKTDGSMSVWGKIDEGSAYSENQAWTYFNVSEDNRHALPQLAGVSVVRYDGLTYVLGTPDDGSATLYCSRDGGITWAADTVMAVPDNLAEGLPVNMAKALTLTADKNNFIWVVNVKSGRTWRGRINRLGWKKEQSDFTE